MIWLKRLAQLIGAGLLAYMGTALMGSLLPVNADWQEAKRGITIHVHDNGIHTSLILPRLDPEHDLGSFFRDPPGFPGQRERYPWLAVGWGDRDFYMNTPTWSDFTLGTALTAIKGSGSHLIHIDRLEELPPGDLRALTLTPEEYGRLTKFITAELDGGMAGLSGVLPGYGSDDRFFEAGSGRAYSAFYTCNNWAADALAEAGVRVGRWTPFSSGVIWWF